MKRIVVIDDDTYNDHNRKNQISQDMDKEAGKRSNNDIINKARTTYLPRLQLNGPVRK